MARNWHDKSAAERGYGNEWRKLRRQVLDRDKFLCVLCRAQGRIEKAAQVDHIIRKKDGGTDDLDNLQSLCKVCHDFKTTRENGGKPKLVAGFDGWPVEDPLDRGHRVGGQVTMGLGLRRAPRASPGTGRGVKGSGRGGKS